MAIESELCRHAIHAHWDGSTVCMVQYVFGSLIEQGALALMLIFNLFSAHFIQYVLDLAIHWHVRDLQWIFSSLVDGWCLTG